MYYKLGDGGLPSICFQGVDLRQYSKQVESELQRIEQASIKDCILHVELF